VNNAHLSGLLELESLCHLSKGWHKDRKKVVFTNGVFDLLHVGHVEYLEQARALGDILVIGLNSDASVRRIKGPQRPLVPQEERARLLLALRPVDYLTIFEQPTAIEIIEKLQPDVYVKGADYHLTGQVPEGATPKYLPEEPVVRQYGGEVKLLAYLPGHSTTELIQKILQVYRT
jgi:D-beta-D-heptose 7-phosphate kinase/D-beta-D-heptose 1-phosphate adenosyltransferase